jgi:hypothetical protein
MGMSIDGFPITPFLKSWAYEQQAHKKANKYVATWKNKVVELRADTEQEAIQLLTCYFRCRSPKHIRIIRIS